VRNPVFDEIAERLTFHDTASLSDKEQIERQIRFSGRLSGVGINEFLYVEADEFYEHFDALSDRTAPVADPEEEQEYAFQFNRFGEYLNARVDAETKLMLLKSHLEAPVYHSRRLGDIQLISRSTYTLLQRAKANALPGNPDNIISLADAREQLSSAKREGHDK